MNLLVKYTLAARSTLLNPWTGFYFLQSFVINFALGYPLSYVQSLLYAAGFSCTLLLLWRSTPRIQKGLIAVCSLMAAIYFPFGHAYGPPGFNTLLALHATNMGESREMLMTFPWYLFLVSAFILGLGVIACRRKVTPKRSWNHFDNMCLVISVVSFFITPIHSLMLDRPIELKDSGYPVFRFVENIIANNQAVIDEHAHMQEFARMKDSWNVTAVQPKYHNYVVVIGESARRDALGAFGGHWNNTPFASSVNGNLFLDYISAGASTEMSLGLSLNQVIDGKPQYQNNFITLANRAGFQTWWFSNQGQIGEFDTAIASIAKRAEKVNFLKQGDYETDNNTRDEDLLKMTEQVLSAHSAKPQLIVLHLMGSHPQACVRTQDKYTQFVQSKETSCYLYSMTQTDDLLKQVYQQLQSTGDSFSMVYFSDHGLEIKKRGTDVQYLAHSDQHQQNFQVPFMVLSSDDKAHNLIKAQRSANDFLDFFSVWTGIKTKQLMPKYNFISEEKVNPAYVTDFKLNRVDYTQLPTDIIPTH